MPSHRIVALGLVASLAALPAAAAAKFFAYNETTSTSFAGVYLAPAGTTNWGANETLNDKDHTLDFGERLLLTGVTPGRYDAKLVTDKGKTCVRKDVDLTRDTSFEIRDGDLAGCR